VVRKASIAAVCECMNSTSEQYKCVLIRFAPIVAQLRQAMQKQAAAAARAAKEGRLLEAATKKAQTAVILLESGAPKEEPVAATAKAEGQVAIKEEAEEDSGGEALLSHSFPASSYDDASF